MPTGVPAPPDEFTHLGTKNAWYHRHKHEVSSKAKQFRKEYPELAKEQDRVYREKYPETVKRCSKNYKRKHKQKPHSPQYMMLANARARAKRENYPCSITMKDIIFPKFCPITNLELRFNKGKTAEDSYTLDKIIPELGYVPGNIRVISRKANRWKDNMTRENIQTLLDYIDGKI